MRRLKGKHMGFNVFLVVGCIFLCMEVMYVIINDEFHGTHFKVKKKKMQSDLHLHLYALLFDL
jgi:hypothetical protein